MWQLPNQFLSELEYLVLIYTYFPIYQKPNCLLE
nr:MAG TPA: hypothetical protein [Bacteriophage sp.]